MIATFANRMAGFVWGFATAWLAMLAAFTYVFVRDGTPAGYSTGFFVGVLAFFWLGGAGLVCYVGNVPCTFVRAERGAGVRANWRYPFRSLRKSYAVNDVQPAEVVEEKDSDGDPYWHARVRFADGRAIDLAEGRDCNAIAEACRRFNQALFGSDQG